MRNIKKLTKKDRYGNQISYEFESPVKPLDPTALMKAQMEMEEMPVPPMQTPSFSYDHPGEPRGSDTVPAWLTPGEFVVNREAMQDPQNAATVHAINNEGRTMQARGGGMVPPMYYQPGGRVYDEDEISPMEQAILDQEAAAAPPPEPEVPEPGFWQSIGNWITDTSVADERNAAFNEKAAAANAAAAQESLNEMQIRKAEGLPVNEHTLKGVQRSVEHTKKRAAETAAARGNIPQDILDAEGVVASESAIAAAGVKPGEKKAESTITTPSDDVLERLGIAQQEEADAGEETTSPTGEPEKENEATEAGNKASNKEKSESLGMLKGIFGDLLDTKELQRMAVLYTGSRLLGYSHAGSLDWAAKGYLNRIDAKAANNQKFAEEHADDYTAESLETYKNSGRLTDLVPVASDSAVIPQGEFKTFFDSGGKQVQAQKVKTADGGYAWITNDGRRVNSNFRDDPSRIKGTPEYTKRIQDETSTYGSMIDEFNKDPANKVNVGKDGKISSPKLNLKPTTTGNQIARWSVENEVDPEIMGDVVSLAYQDALAFREAEIERGNSGQINSLKPFLDEAFIKAKVGNPELFRNEDGEPISIAKITPLLDDVETMLRRGNPERYGAMSAAEVDAEFISYVREDWAALGVKGQKEWNDQANDTENGFLIFAQQKARELQTKIANQNKE